MGGFTQIKLKNCSSENIEAQNKILSDYKVSKKYRFNDLEKEQYEFYKKGVGAFPDYLFPKDKIHSIEDFKKYWNPEALGEVFASPSGVLCFDCYFGRTSKNAMKNLGKYIANNISEFAEFTGSFSTFMKRGMTEKQRQIVDKSGIEY